jgi:hypothetical protein
MQSLCIQCFAIVVPSVLVSSDFATVSRLGPSLPFFLRGVTALSPWASVLSGSLAHPWLWSTYSLRHATPARRDTFLQAAANFLQDLQIPRVSSFGSPRRPAARCRPRCCFFIVAEDFTAASSVRTSRWSTSDSMSSENPDTPPSLPSRISSFHARHSYWLQSTFLAWLSSLLWWLSFLRPSFLARPSSPVWIASFSRLYNVAIELHNALSRQIIFPIDEIQLLTPVVTCLSD